MARQIGTFSTNERSILSFEVTEAWKGSFNPRDFVKTTSEGYLRAAQGEHGVRVVAGQEIVFFFTRHNQPKEKLAHHSTAFPVQNGKIVYASTGDADIRREMSVEDFKRVIVASDGKP